MWPFDEDQYDEVTGKPIGPGVSAMPNDGLQKPLDPTITNYYKQKAGLDQKFDQARKDADSSNMMQGVIQGLSTAFTGPKHTDGAFYNNLRSQNEARVSQADSDRKNLSGEFGQMRQMKDWESKDSDTAEDHDPNSMKSQVARATAMKFGGSKIIPADKIATMSAADIMKNMPFLERAYQSDMQASTRKDALSATSLQRQQDQANKDREFSLKEKEFAGKTEPKDFTARVAKLNATDKARFDNVVMSSTALKDMSAALDAGQNTFSIIGDNDFTAANARFTEALGRMQSGGAIGKDEQKKFMAMAPKASDSAVMQQKKLSALQSEMTNRLSTLGFQRDEVPALLSWKSPITEFDKDGTAMAATQPLNDDDKAAIQWAQDPKNKADPRASQILKLHGVK